MIRNNVATEGVEPFYEDVYLGSDGQLFRWGRGQEVIATSGPEAVHYAQSQGFQTQAGRAAEATERQELVSFRYKTACQ